MTTTIDLDHTSFAVKDALEWARRLRRDLGATPLIGEALEEFRYLQLYIGTASTGARIELIEPVRNGFLTRFLDRHGEGPHHITFTVPDLRTVVATARDLGATVVGENHDNPSWREAFLMPDHTHAVVIQLAQTDFAYPTPAELLATQRRDNNIFPSSYSATDPHWWAPLWDTPTSGCAALGATHLGSADLDHTRTLFGDLLDAHVSTTRTGLELTWPSGSILVHLNNRAGVLGMNLSAAPAGAVRIGKAILGHPFSDP